jgi:ketosteroid isomerase-like protein
MLRPRVEEGNTMQPVELIKQIYADYARGDIDAVLENCDHTLEFNFVADPKYSKYAGAAVGKHGFRELAARLHDDFEYVGFEQIDLIADGGRIAVRNELRMKRRATGVEVVIEVADFWTIRGGKAVEVVEFYDSALLARVL